MFYRYIGKKIARVWINSLLSLFERTINWEIRFLHDKNKIKKATVQSLYCGSTNKIESWGIFWNLALN